MKVYLGEEQNLVDHTLDEVLQDGHLRFFELPGEHEIRSGTETAAAW